MGGTEVDWIARAEAAGATLREETRRAHEATKDLKTARRELDETVAGMNDRLMKYVDAQLEGLGNATRDAMKASTDKVGVEVDKLYDILMGRGDPEKVPFDTVVLAFQLLQLIKSDPDRVAIMDRVSGKIIDPAQIPEPKQEPS